MDEIVDRIESKRVEKFTKFFKYLAIITAILAVLKISIRPEILRGDGSYLDFIVTLAPIGIYLRYKKMTRKFHDQFIDWTPTSINFKTKNRGRTVLLSELEGINISLDNIVLKLKDGTIQTISIEDFAEYEDRIRIKSNFEKIKQGLTLSQT